ncbi:MAG: hypothetical protein B7Z61_12390 [Acidobacteria bacterium 37-71-11]|nr:MAG: hypothetical protein B7Z61_12390 [Acidobacteria bacterium 37-71-11]
MYCRLSFQPPQRTGGIVLPRIPGGAVPCRWPARSARAIMGGGPNDRTTTHARCTPGRGRAAGVSRLPADARPCGQGADRGRPPARRSGRRRGSGRHHHVERVSVVGRCRRGRRHRPVVPGPDGRAARLPAPPAVVRAAPGDLVGVLRRQPRSHLPPASGRALVRRDAGHGGGRPLHVSRPEGPARRLGRHGDQGLHQGRGGRGPAHRPLPLLARLPLPAHGRQRRPYRKWRTTDFEKILVTGGPFRLAAHIPQQTIVLQRDPTYWNAPRPYLDRLVFRILPDMAGQLAQLFAGDVDVVPSVAPQEADRVAADPDLRLVEYPSRLWGLVGWNNRRSMFADRRVRRALSLGINRKALVDTVFRGHAKLATGPILSSMWAFDRSLPQLPYDQAQAAALLAQAGWRDSNGDGILERDGKPFAFDLLYPAANTLRREMALLIQADLARLGIKVRPVQVEFTSLIARVEAGDFDAVLWAWEEATKIDLTSTWSTPSPGQGSNNFIGYSNPEVDRMIAIAREEPDYTRAKVLLDRIQEAIVADQPVTFLYEANRLVATSRRLEGADINAAGVFFNIDDWYWSR